MIRKGNDTSSTMFTILLSKVQSILEEKKDKGFQDIVNILQQNIDHYSWVGIYFVKGQNLVLGPWRGPKATEHTEIPIGNGICGSAAASGRTEIIADVHKDQRYLSCFLSTKSEIVVPIIHDDNVVGEIDIDSDEKDAFSNDDRLFLEKIADMLAEHIHRS